MATYDTGEAWDALGDRTRRRILELVAQRPRSVGEVADELPVSRPAVSQHLKVLGRAGLVRHRKQGTRRLYSADPTGLAGLHGEVERFWQEALASFKAVVEEE